MADWGALVASREATSFLWAGKLRETLADLICQAASAASCSLSAASRHGQAVHSAARLSSAQLGMCPGLRRESSPVRVSVGPEVASVMFGKCLPYRRSGASLGNEGQRTQGRAKC